MAILDFPPRKRRKATRPAGGPAAAAEVAVFPYGRRRDLVQRHAHAMRDLSPNGREKYLNRVLDGICADLRAIGVVCEDCECEALLEFLGAMGRELHGPDFVVEPEEIAQ